MNRRDVLVRGAIAVAGLTSIAGCTKSRLEEAQRNPEPLNDTVAEEEVDLPVEQRFQVAADGIERAGEADIEGIDDLESYLGEQGVAVETLEEAEEHGEPIVSLEYAFEERIEEGLLYHLGIVAGGYAALVDADHESERLHATVLDPDAGKYGEYDVERRWADEYVSGKITAREYADEVLVTTESSV